MKGLPQISYWRERVTPRPPAESADSNPSAVIYACHAVRNWDMPSNGVFLLFTADELHGRVWEKRVDWRQKLKEALEARERRMVREYQRHWRHNACEFFPDEIWTTLSR